MKKLIKESKNPDNGCEEIKQYYSLQPSDCMANKVLTTNYPTGGYFEVEEGLQIENKYTIEQMSEIHSFYTFTNVNEKGEKLIIELTKIENCSSPNSLPELWKKHGYIDRVLESYWSIQTYVKDTEGNSFGIYNPQHKMEEYEEGRKRSVIDFDWMLESSEENRIKLINKVYQLFSSAKGETATEVKNRKIKEYAIKNNIDIYKTIPEGWKMLDGSLVAPIGTVWICNMESFRSRKRKMAILFPD